MPPSPAAATQPTNKPSARFGFIIFAMVIAIAILLRMVQWVFPATQPPLLSQADGLVRLTDSALIADHADTPISLPEKTFGATLKVIGVYTKPTPAFPQGTVSLVYVRSAERFVEMQMRPKETLEAFSAGYPNAAVDQVVLREGTTATLLTLRETSTCKRPRAPYIGVCQFTRALAFERDGHLIVLFADGQRITDGELIEMARSSVDGEGQK
ncbi:hypothetical protein FJZ23_02200 [Candidatus Parcubacteria bacterium]|nr:hypothetical protein [Candidatus Parcubacteria bacterium]